MTSPKPPSADKPEESAQPLRISLCEQERAGIEAVEALLALTRRLASTENAQPPGMPSQEYCQDVLQRGQLIDAIGTLALDTFSDAVRAHLTALLRECQFVDPAVLSVLTSGQQKLGEQLQGLKSSQSVQSRYLQESQDASATRQTDA